MAEPAVVVQTLEINIDDYNLDALSSRTKNSRRNSKRQIKRNYKN
jgi:hypothetical protein